MNARTATRGNGGTSWLRPRALAVLGVALLTLVVWVSAADAVKYYDSFFGNTGTAPTGNLADGGLFNTPRDVVVNESTDQIYVVDDANHRIQRFSSTGVFERAWGRDVVETGGTGDVSTTAFEICSVAAQCKVGTVGTAGGMLDNPQGIAIDHDTGDVYVTDRDNFRVQRFDADGAFERAFGFDVSTSTAGAAPEICTTDSDCKIGVAGNAAGQFGSTFNSRPAVSQPDGNPATGSIFVPDPANRRVQQYDLDGNFTRAWGWGVATAANQFEVCTAPCLPGIAPPFAGANGQFGSSQPAHLAVDSAGVVYASDSTDNRVLRFDSTQSTAVDLLDPALDVTGISATSSATTAGLEVDPDSDGGGSDVNRLLVGRGDPIGVLEINLATAALADTHVPASGVAQNGLGVNVGLDRLYVPSTTTAHRVYVADADGAGPASMTLNPATNVQTHSATLSGLVNPGGPTGIATSYRFQYSKNGSSWTDVAPAASVGDGSSPVLVDDELTGLDANTLYRFRIVTQKGFGNPEVVSPEQVFVTDAAAPLVTTLYPGARTDTTARLAGSIDPNGRPTDYHFEYGTSTNYGTDTAEAVVTGGQPKVVTTDIDGLAPDTVYHYRLVASNEDGAATGADQVFRTRAATPAPPARAWEMVTPANKPITTVGGGSGAPRGMNANPIVPSLDGESAFWSTYIFPQGEEAWPFDASRSMIRRTADGWETKTLLTQKPLPGEDPLGLFDNNTARPLAMSGDLQTQSWFFDGPILENEGSRPLSLYTRRDGTGVNGFTGWLRNTELQGPQVPEFSFSNERSLYADDGSWVVRWGLYRGLLDDPETPAAEDPSVMQLAPVSSANFPGGQAAYLQHNPPLGGLDLVHECSGTVAGGDATQIPERTAGGMLDVQDCEAGAVTSVRGAAVGAHGGISSNLPAGVMAGPAATAVSEDARRVFFVSPDPTASAIPASCAAGVGAATSCPPQLYVRQYDENGENPVVRWISRPAPGMPAQQIGLLGRGAVFEGASDDGSVVYFRTNAPLTADDRNATGAPGPVTTGTASPQSWDLYRYELPEDLDDDPADGTFTRISGGPTGDADPNTNCAVLQSGNCNATSGGAGGAARFVSDDGQRAYFVTTSPLAGADATPPQGATTTPGGAVNDIATRNLYLFDANETGADRWRFVARLPLVGGSGIGASQLTRCASFHSTSGAPTLFSGTVTNLRLGENGSNCLRGTPDGRMIVFLTAGQLTADDTDNAADIYLYDRDDDELVRVSAPPPGAEPYACLTETGGALLQTCNAGLGFGAMATSNNSGEFDRTRGRSGGRGYNIAENPDGTASLFFETRLALLPEDVNGDYWDVYEWREGELSLVSPGNSDDHSYYSGVSTDGQDLFVQTEKRIDPREISDKDLDIYDLRVGGGFPPPPPPVDRCDGAGDGCQGGGADPVDADVESDGNGDGNVRSPGRFELSVATVSRIARARAARSGVLALRVRRSGPGSVTAVARARLGKRARKVASATASLSRAGAATLRLRLSRPARQRLRKGRALRLTVAVSSQGARGRTLSLVLRRAK